MRQPRTRTSIFALLLLVLGACGRSDTATPSDKSSTTTKAPAGADKTALSEGGFGDLESVCQDGDASGATATGVTDTEIHVGTVTDKGNPVVSGLNKEMYDAAVAFTSWCNEHGGILGRKLVLDDLDAALFQFEARITEACERDLALVGGGAVYDDDPNNVRVGCGLANIAGYVVTAPARNADLQVQPVPNPLEKINVGRYRAAAREYPEGIKSFGVMSANVPAVTLVRDQLLEAGASMGYKVIYQVQYAALGESGWANFVADMQAKDVKVLEFVGQPGDLIQLDRAMDTAGWHPDLVMLSANFYDTIYGKEAGAIAGNLSIQSQFHPFEQAAENKATKDYLDLMAQYNADGKVALLGAQGVSSWLLFARAATACGSELTAACLVEKAAAVSDWTGGGLHAPQTPGNTQPSDCWLSLSLGADGFSLNKAVTKANEGVYNCDPGNVLTLKGG